MQLERRALYNTLRFGEFPSPVRWQVEDYRILSFDQLWHRLAELGLLLNKEMFQTLAEDAESPEDFADQLSHEIGEQEKADQVYLVVFELWRRLLPERQTLSILCDECDYQIYLYDRGLNHHVDDCIESLKEVLDENVDNGVKPRPLFESVATQCAHDLESFLYDYAVSLIDQGDPEYAEEILDGFHAYVSAPEWFDFLTIRLDTEEDLEAAMARITKLLKEPNLELLFEILHFLVRSGDHKTFQEAVKKILPFLETEADFADLLQSASDYFHFHDQDGKEKALQSLLAKRTNIPCEKPFDRRDATLLELQKLLKN